MNSIVNEKRSAALLPTPKDLENRLYKAKEVARLLGLAESTLYDGIRMRNALYPAPIFLGNLMRFTKMEILDCRKRREEYYLESWRGHT